MRKKPGNKKENMKKANMRNILNQKEKMKKSNMTKNPEPKKRKSQKDA